MDTSLMNQYKLQGTSKKTGASIYKHTDGHVITIKKDGYGVKWEHHSADRSVGTMSYGAETLIEHLNKFHGKVNG